ncbi:hypothetical protein DdX_16634 [Ditylenchus destructor]|uniref:Uncharacterized protein n=1 Tax=Ditylenchus destructor TaxID=166010 RepID=A0AAD4MSU8_9BILA|nr:hypothetical protein DdX_16634 [Ditylenchus destructor]
MVRCAARFRACDTSIASSRREESIGTGLADKICEYRDLWLPEIRKIQDDHGRRHAAKPLGFLWYTLLICWCPSVSACSPDV